MLAPDGAICSKPNLEFFVPTIGQESDQLYDLND